MVIVFKLGLCPAVVGIAFIQLNLFLPPAKKEVISLCFPLVLAIYALQTRGHTLKPQDFNEKPSQPHLTLSLVVLTWRQSLCCSTGETLCKRLGHVHGANIPGFSHLLPPPLPKKQMLNHLLLFFFFKWAYCPSGEGFVRHLMHGPAVEGWGCCLTFLA